jgi:type VI secretion system protein ImpC
VSSERFRVELTATGNPEPRRESGSGEDPVRIVILGDFQGIGARAVGPGSSDSIGAPVAVDGETLDHVVRRFSPRLQTALGRTGQLDLTFEELEDFHPDRLLRSAPPLEGLRRIRSRAERPSESIAELRREASLPPRKAQPDPARPKPARRPPPTGSVLDWIVEGDNRAEPAAPSDLDRFVDEVVAPHLTAEPDADRAALMADLDTEVSSRLRQLLHDPHFQSLEALWRGTALLVHRLETGTALRVHVLQATRGALLADARAAADPNRSQLGRALRALPQDGPTLLVADLFFDARDEDLEILQSLGRAAFALGGIVIGGAGPGLIGVGESSAPEGPWDVHPWDHPDWIAFRRSPEAESVALALPRVLLREPYGQAGESIRTFEFEETSVPTQPSELLWANPAFVAALILGEKLASGSPPSAEDRLEASSLPVHSWKGPDGSVLVPCTEWTMRTDVAGALLKAGFMALVPSGNGDSARLLRFQTLESGT